MTYQEKQAVLAKLTQQIQEHLPKGIVLSFDLYDELRRSGQIVPAKQPSAVFHGPYVEQGTYQSIPVALEDLPAGQEFRPIY